MVHNRAQQLATSDTAAALAAAMRIDDPWVACQSLAWVARFAPDDQVLSIIDRAFKVGRKAEDPYQVVGSAAWPLRALVERGHTDRLGSFLPGVKSCAARTMSPASRCEALFLVYQAVFPAGRRYWLSVLSDLAGCADPTAHWRVGRAMRDAVLIAANEDLEFARDFAGRIGNDKVRAQIERGLDRLQFRPPRPFFWRGAGA
jgi:hypothetical protein